MSSLILIGKVAATSVIAGTALVAGVNATHADGSTAAAASKDKGTVSCARYRHAPADLKAALKKVRALPAGTERREAARKLRKEVRTGTYGDQVRLAAQRREIRRLRLLAKAPDQLKTDLKAAVRRPAGKARKDAVQQVWKSAAAGTYGDDVKKLAAKAVQRRETCQARHEAHQQKKDASPSASTT